MMLVIARHAKPSAVTCANVPARAAGDVLFEVVNSLFQVFVAREEMPITLLKKNLARQVRLVFAGLATNES